MGNRTYLGFYVHHHGSGHLTRTLLMAKYLNVPVKILCSKEKPALLPKNVDYVQLPLDTDEPAMSGTSPGFLHYAATQSPAINTRMRIIAEACRDIRLLVVDVSVEVTLLARLLSVPTLVTLMHGDRSDTAHHLAYESAHGLLAPYPLLIEQPDLPLWIKRKTTYVGCYSKSLGRERIRQTEAKREIDVRGKTAVVSTSLGGTGVPAESIAKLARKSPEWTWVIVGLMDNTDTLPSNVRVVGVVDDIWPYLCAADVVIGSGGYNMITEIGSANKPAILIPEERPYNEQLQNILCLERASIITTFADMDEFSDADNIPEILETARTKPLVWEKILDENAPRQLAEAITSHYHRLVW